MSRPGGGWRGRSERRTMLAVPVTVISLVFLFQSPAAADVDSVQGSAFGVNVTGFLGVIPPTPAVSLAADETSPPAELGPFNGASAGTSLPGFPGIFSTGALTVATSAMNVSGDDHSGFVEARTSAQTVNAGAGLATATSIASSCRAGADGSTGSTVIQGGMLNGQPFASPTPEPNTVIPVEGLGTVTLNEQVRSDVPGSSSIVVNAVHARYEGGAGGILPQDQSAEAIIGQVVCQAVGPDVNAPDPPPDTTVPATTTTTAPAVTITAPTVPAETLPVSGGAESVLGLALVALVGARLVWLGRGRRLPSSDT